jgi:hypothetical protein
MRMLILTGLALAAIFPGVASANTAAAGSQKVVNASSFGWNAEDSTAALQAAFDSGANKVIIDRQAGDWISRPLFITNSNIEVVLADGVTLKAKRGEFHGRSECLIRITGKSKNIVLRGEGKATIKMNKADYQDPKQNYKHSEWRHAVSILSAQNVTVKDLAILSSGGDGVYLNGPKGVTLENLVLQDHHRQGMSPINVSDMIARRCVFNDTRGTPPNCGIDMEPNNMRNRYVNVVYEDCEFNGNAAHGICLYLGHFSAKTHPISVTFRRCKAYGNKGSGMSFMTGSPVRIEKSGQVKGFVKFENCEFAGNDGVALKISNLSTNGMDISFSDCIIDARGSRSECAIWFNNSRLNGDFGSVTFERCSVKLDEGKKVCAFEAPRGYGIGGKLVGELAVERGEKREVYNLDAFAAKHKPRPELISTFKSTTVDHVKLKPMFNELPAKGKFTPFVRKPFVYVVAVPGAGEYKVRFKSKKLRVNGTGPIAAVVQMLDKVGTDLGTTEVPVGDFEYTVKANGANVYRFEVSQRNMAVVRMACDGAAGALQADAPVRLYKGRNEVFNFCVPARAEFVSVNVVPMEKVSAELIDATGKVVRSMPYQGATVVFEVKRQKTECDEIWKLRFPMIQEDMSFQIGGEALPLVSVDEEVVIGGK